MIDCGSIYDLAISLGCKAEKEKNLRNYTTIKIGGICPLFIEINCADSCRELVKKCSEMFVSFVILGKGSNVIIDDNGIDSVVLYMGNDFSDIKLTDENTICCNAGTPLSRLCQFALENSLGGLEFAWGIPGTVGGAVYMNAGAYGGEIKDVIFSASACDNSGYIFEYKNKDMNLSYRKSVFSDNKQIILSASFKLQKQNTENIKNRMAELLEKRKSKQPLEYPSAGSMFKRPEGNYAAALIEQSGLKGFNIGGAEVSTKHSGFVINKDNSSFNDMMKLIQYVKDNVFEKTGYMLEHEPIILSDRKD